MNEPEFELQQAADGENAILLRYDPRAQALYVELMMERSERQKAEKRVIALKTQVTYLNETLAKKNRELDALHYVWCDGGCKSGVHRYHDEPISEEIVLEAEKQASRLRRWWNNAKNRQ